MPDLARYGFLFGAVDTALMMETWEGDQQIARFVFADFICILSTLTNSEPECNSRESNWSKNFVGGILVILLLVQEMKSF